MTVSADPTTLQDQFTTAMEGFYGSLSGIVGMKVQDLDTGLTLTWNEHEVFPTASTLKIPLLYELYRQADAGEVDLTERVTLLHSDRVPGSGVYQHLDEGLQPTYRDLAELMITVSDNWATDIIYRKLGRELGLFGCGLSADADHGGAQPLELGERVPEAAALRRAAAGARDHVPVVDQADLAGLAGAGIGEDHGTAGQRR